jgi:hypothetical protein
LGFQIKMFIMTEIHCLAHYDGRIEHKVHCSQEEP